MNSINGVIKCDALYVRFGKIIVETPSRQVKELFKAARIKIPASLGTEDFETEYLLKPKVKNQE